MGREFFFSLKIFFWVFLKALRFVFFWVSLGDFSFGSSLVFFWGFLRFGKVIGCFFCREEFLFVFLGVERKLTRRKPERKQDLEAF